LPKDIQRTVGRKSLYLDDAEDLQDLKAAPGHRLEKLKGQRSGQYPKSRERYGSDDKSRYVGKKMDS
jgi:plasmid maintenance system killer protein